jgi:hypothetical protein
MRQSDAFTLGLAIMASCVARKFRYGLRLEGVLVICALLVL